MAASDTRARLLASARSLIASRGFADASLADIAAGAGLTKGAIFRRFRGKEDLLLALVDDWRAAVLAAMEAGRGTPFETLADFVAGEGQGAVWRALVLEFWRQALDHGQVRSRLNEAYASIREQAASLLSGWRSDATADALAGRVIALHDGLLILEALGDDRVQSLTPSDLVEALRSGRGEAPERAAS